MRVPSVIFPEPLLGGLQITLKMTKSSCTDGILGLDKLRTFTFEQQRLIVSQPIVSPPKICISVMKWISLRVPKLCPYKISLSSYNLCNLKESRTVGPRVKGSDFGKNYTQAKWIAKFSISFIRLLRQVLLFAFYFLLFFCFWYLCIKMY